MIVLSQRDPKWSQLKLLPSNLTIGRYGCTTTAISMLSDYFGCFADPGQAAGHNIKYTNEGLIIWPSINFCNFKFDKRLNSFDPAAINESLKDPKKAVILEVDHSHWVVALSKTLTGDAYNIADPWFGDKSTTRRYHNVTGSAHFIRK